MSDESLLVEIIGILIGSFIVLDWVSQMSFKINPLYGLVISLIFLLGNLVAVYRAFYEKDTKSLIWLLAFGLALYIGIIGTFELIVTLLIIFFVAVKFIYEE